MKSKKWMSASLALALSIAMEAGGMGAVPVQAAEQTTAQVTAAGTDAPADTASAGTTAAATGASADTAASDAVSTHRVSTQELINLLDADPELKALVEKSIAQAAAINPDRSTNPAQSLDEVYDFIDYSLTRMPWNILENDYYSNFATKCDQSILYIYWLLDQPMDELKDQDLFYNSVEYLEPIYKWLTDYNNEWKAYLDSPESWNDDYYQMLLKDPTWNLDKGWYEDPSNWHSFNDFFARKLSSIDARPIASPEDDTVVTSPADSLPQGVWNIGDDGTFLADPITDEDGVLIKSSTYVSAAQMLGDEGAAYADAFNGGYLTHTYLNYDDYHCYHVPVSGTVVAKYIVPYRNAVGGIVYWDAGNGLYRLESNSLSWQAYETRGCVIIDTDEYGLVAVLPIGMGQVSSVNFTDNIQVGQKVTKGDILGYFLFGGSDCVMLFQKESGFQITAPAGEQSGYANGYAHIYCNQEYGRFTGTADSADAGSAADTSASIPDLVITMGNGSDASDGSSFTYNIVINNNSGTIVLRNGDADSTDGVIVTKKDGQSCVIPYEKGSVTVIR